MDEDKKLLESMNTILQQIKTEKKEDSILYIIEKNNKIFRDYLVARNRLCKSYQFGDENNGELSEMQNLFFSVTNNILNLGSFLDTYFEGTKFSNYLGKVADAIYTQEKGYIEELSVENIEQGLNIIDLYSNRMREYYQQTIKDQIRQKGNNRFIFNNNIYKFVYMDSKTFKMAILTNFIAENFSEIPEELLKSLMNKCEEIVKEVYTNTNFDEIEFEDDLSRLEIINYIDIIIRIKSIFYRGELKNDFLVEEFLNGRIKDDDITEKIAQNIPISIFGNIINANDGCHFFKKLDEYLKNRNFSDSQTKRVFKALLSKENEIDFLIHDLVLDYNIVTCNEKELDLNKNGWVVDNYNTIKKLEKMYLLNGYNVYLSVEYYKAIIMNKNQNKNLSDESYQIICENLLELLKTDFFNDEEKTDLRELLKNHTEIGKYMEDDYHDLNFDDEKSNIESLKKMYYNGQIIPYNSALEVLRDENYFFEHIKNKKSMEGEICRLQFKLAVKSIIYNRMNDIGINISVFFERVKNIEGAHYFDYAIYINLDDVEKYINDNPETFIYCLGHEMNHAIDDYNKIKLNIDYSLFLDLEEKTILFYDSEFYDEFYEDFNNHDIMYAEINADIEGFIFGKSSGGIFDLDDMQNRLRKRKEELASKKTNSVGLIKLGKYQVKIELKEAIRRILKNNPEEFSKYNGIFKIKYNMDGTEKDINTLLKDFYKIARNTRR